MKSTKYIVKQFCLFCHSVKTHQRIPLERNRKHLGLQLLEKPTLTTLVRQSQTDSGKCVGGAGGEQGEGIRNPSPS